MNATSRDPRQRSTRRDLRTGGTARSWGGLASVVGSLLVAALTGCASSSPPPLLLTLPPALAASAAAPPAASSPASAAPPAALLAIRRIDVPEYLVSRRVRFRTDAATLAEWPNALWAERIEVAVSREFTSALRRQLPGWATCDATCGDQAPTLALQIDLQAMDFVRSAQHLQGRARITISATGAAPHVLLSEDRTYDLPAAADTPQAQAQAMTELLRQLASAVGPMVRNAAR